MRIAPIGSTIDGVEHHRADLGGTSVHYVAAGDAGSPILLVHGFPESWWAFHEVIPLLARTHRVFAVDLPGFGDSAVVDLDHGSAATAATLHGLVQHLDVGPVHLVAQDVAGGSVLRLATGHASDVASITAIELGLSGFGLEALGDVTRGGSWHVGVLATPSVAELLLPGREHALLAQWAFPSMTVVEGAVSPDDVAELGRGLARDGGWRGAIGLYRSMLDDGDELRALVQRSPLGMPLLAVGGGGGAFTASTLRQVAARPISSIELAGVGHHVALEAPDRLAAALLDFLAEVDAPRPSAV